MSNEAINEDILVREFTKELHNRNAAVFAGAGLSMASGYVDWKGLLKDIMVDLGLDPNAESDLVTIAQYHCNQAGGNRNRLSQTIFEHFSQTRVPTDNHRILAALPIHTYWTTNYDKLIEKALENEKKTPDVKYTHKQLSVTRMDRDVVVYKMHGDIDHPADAVISRDDYENYSYRMGDFVSALRGDLIEKTFLFLGFSFTDPNIDYILSRVRATYETNQRHHYSIQRAVTRSKDESEDDFKYRQLKQHLFIKDLKRFAIQTVLVSDFTDITRLLKRIENRYKSRSVFISGAVEDFGTWSPTDLQGFLHHLSFDLSQSTNRIITGFGVGVGGPIINGCLTHLSSAGKTISDDYIVMRPFPQMATGAKTLSALWTEYRKEMIAYAGIAIFVFGNKRDPTGQFVPSNGMREEFDICVQANVRPIPIGATGSMAKTLWDEVMNDFDAYYPNATPAFRDKFALIGDASQTPYMLRKTVLELVSLVQKS